MPILSSTLEQMRWYRERSGGRKEASYRKDKFKRYLTKVNTSGEGKQGIISRVKWRMRYRYKTIIDKKLRARTEEGRAVEALLACIVLNRFTELGRYRSEFVA